jgi:hypothetical protein
MEGVTMNNFMKDRLQRRLEALSDERLYQVLDYIEFLESKYAEHKPAPPNVFQRFAEGVEDTMRAGKISATAVSETMGLLSKAMGVLNGVTAAGKSVASDIAGAATGAVARVSSGGSVRASEEPAAPAQRPPKEELKSTP